MSTNQTDLATLRQKLEEAEKERDDAKFSRDHWQTSYEDEDRANKLLIHTTTKADNRCKDALRVAGELAASVNDLIQLAYDLVEIGGATAIAGSDYALDQAREKLAAYHALTADGTTETKS